MRKREIWPSASLTCDLLSLSYSVFFAAFDMTRRAGLRVKALFGGEIQSDWANIVVLDLPDSKEGTPTRARIAQAVTIVSGGILASLAADMAGRPFRACQRIMHQSSSTEVLVRHPNPIIHTLRTQGLKPFLHPDELLQSMAKPSTKAVIQDGSMKRVARRVGWRIAAVGPWGLGFLVWAYVGGEV